MHAYIHTYINFVKNVVYSSSERSLHLTKETIRPHRNEAKTENTQRKTLNRLKGILNLL